MFDLLDFKTYLRIDADQTDTDREIERLITAAASLVERKTNHVLIRREKTYFPVNGKVRVYDYPISVPVPFGVDYTSSYADIYADVPVTVMAGYNEREAPEALVEAVFQIVEHWYYGSEKTATPTIPPSVEEILNIFRRFI